MTINGHDIVQRRLAVTSEWLDRQFTTTVGVTSALHRHQREVQARTPVPAQRPQSDYRETQTREHKLELEIPIPAKSLTDPQRQLVELLQGYQWYSSETRHLARQACEAMAVALRNNLPDQANMMTGAVLDLLHRDRALRAGSVIPHMPEPQREVPQSITVTTPRLATLHRSALTELRGWRKDIPVEALPAISTVITHASPDALFFVDYSVPQIRDPFIYAKYGDWYVLVAQWT